MMLLQSFISASVFLWTAFNCMVYLLLKWEATGKGLGRLLQRHSINISCFHVGYFTTRMNRTLRKIAKYDVRLWFNAGVVTSTALMIASVYFLLYNLMWAYRELTTPIVEGQPSKQVLQVMVPGVNFPINQIGFLFVAVFINGFLHELGHAVAAIREGVAMHGVGVFVCYVYPGAYVNIDKCDHIHPNRRLRIYCAGVWHNVVLSLLAFLAIFLLPILLFPFYANHHDRVYVQSLNKVSPLAMEGGLKSGDLVRSLDGCVVEGFNEWVGCINHTIHQSQAGSCVKERAIPLLSHRQHITTQPQHCCPPSAPGKNICYRHLDAHHQVLYSCMDARQVMLKANSCHYNRQCSGDEVCLKPLQVEGGPRVMRIEVERDDEPTTTTTILYLGFPHDLLYYVTVTRQQPRIPLLPYNFPAIALKQLQLFFSISMGLGILNIIPCYHLDGQHVFIALVDKLMGNHHHNHVVGGGGGGDDRSKKLVCNVVMVTCSLLVALNFITSFLHAFRKF